jgi:hypothetical protein
MSPVRLLGLTNERAPLGKSFWDAVARWPRGGVPDADDAGFEDFRIVEVHQST